MPGMTERHAVHGPKLTYFPWDAVIGGRLCEADPSHVGYIRHASDASVTVAGMAMQDAAKKSEFAASEWMTVGAVVNHPGAPREVVCYTEGVFYDIECTGAVNEQQKLVAAADGKVRAYVAGTDNAAAIVGKSLTKIASAGKIRVQWNMV